MFRKNLLSEYSEKSFSYLLISFYSFKKLLIIFKEDLPNLSN